MPIPDVDQSMQAAQSHHRAGRLGEAESLYRQILTRQPAHAEALDMLAVIVAGAGRHDHAIELVGRAIAASPQTANFHFHLGTLAQHVGRIDQAIASYQTAISLRRDFPEALYNLGRAWKQKGDLEQAAACYERTILLRPGMAEAQASLGLVRQEQGRLRDAVACFQRALVLNPRHVDAHHNLANAHAGLDELDQAIPCYEKALELRPNFPEAHTGLGHVLRKKGQLEKAIAAHRRALDLNPNLAEAHSNLGVALKEMGEIDQAIACHRRAVELNPHLAPAHSNLGIALEIQGGFDEAMACFEKALTIKPDYAEARVNIGVAAKNQGDVDRAIADYRAAITIAPDLADAHYNLALALLTKGEFAEGWHEHEWRWKTPGLEQPRQFREPSWDGSASDSTVLLSVEQGFGDTIQFVRYAAMVAQRCRRVVLQCQPPLVRLLKTVNDVTDVIPAGAAVPDFDAHASLLSLPLIFATKVETIPASVPYLHADPRRTAAWAARIGRDDRFKIGLAWAGSAKHKNDRNRSIALATLAPLATIPGTLFFSLQKGPAAQQATSAPPGMQVIDYTGDLHDFSDTAALIAHLDLVISVDTSIVHLAGAMGRPVWTMLPFIADWRWLENRTDSPWYPTMRLFRQPAIGDWGTVVNQVQVALRRIIDGRR